MLREVDLLSIIVAELLYSFVPEIVQFTAQISVMHLNGDVKESIFEA